MNKQDRYEWDKLVKDAIDEMPTPVNDIRVNARLLIAADSDLRSLEEVLKRVLLEAAAGTGVGLRIREVLHTLENVS